MIGESVEQPVVDPLAACLLPVLMHRMNNATQLLSNLHTLQQCAGDKDWMVERAADLAETSADVEQLGYLLAVLASASGADLLLERREARGVEILISATCDAVRRDGGEMQAPLQPLPDQSPGVHGGWELPWGFAALLFQAAQASEPGTALGWELLQEEQAWVLVSATVPSDEFAGVRQLILSRLPETTLDVSAEGWSWRLPADWLFASDE